MPSASSWIAARTISATLRLWPRCTTSAPCACNRRRIMLIAASWPSNKEAALTKRNGGGAAPTAGWSRRTAAGAEGLTLIRASNKCYWRV